MFEKQIKIILEDEIKSLTSAVEHGKKDFQSGELSQSEYINYLRMTFQYHLEYILGIKLDIAMPY